jgi:hypothetical protein
MKFFSENVIYDPKFDVDNETLAEAKKSEVYGKNWAKLGSCINTKTCSKTTFYCTLNGTANKCPKRLQFHYAMDSFAVTICESDNEHVHGTRKNHGLAPHVKEAIDSLRSEYPPTMIFNRLKAYPNITIDERPTLEQIYNYFSNNKKEVSGLDEIGTVGQLVTWCEKFHTVLDDFDYEKDTQLNLTNDDKYFVPSYKILDDGIEATCVRVFVTSKRLLTVAIESRLNLK